MVSTKGFFKLTPLKKALIGGCIALELGFFGASYYGYKTINTSRDFRKYLSEKCPTALEWYYELGETINAENTVIRKLDADAWAAEKRQKQ